jgi:hypothetical protein
MDNYETDDEKKYYYENDIQKITEKMISIITEEDFHFTKQITINGYHNNEYIFSSHHIDFGFNILKEYLENEHKMKMKTNIEINEIWFEKSETIIVKENPEYERLINSRNLDWDRLLTCEKSITETKITKIPISDDKSLKELCEENDYYLSVHYSTK